MIVLLACCKTKLKGRHRAEELYQGDLFKKALAYARCYYPDAEVRILSALHGSLSLDDVIEDYEETLVGAKKAEIRAWAAATASGLEEEFGPEAHYLALASAPYRTVFDYLPLSSYEAPLKGLGIGSQKGWLKRKLMECL